MAFKNTSGAEKFSDASKIFSKRELGQTLPNEVNGVHSTSFPNLAQGRELNHGQETTQDNVNNNQQIQPENEIYSANGYNIQSDILSDSHTHASFMEKKHEHGSMVKEILQEQRRHHTGQFRPDSGIDFTDRDNIFTSGTSPYIYYDSKAKTERESATHEKMAFEKGKTTTGGGAEFQAHYAENGKLVTETSLFRDKERTDKYGFRNKSRRFIHKREQIFEDVTPEENEADASLIDSKAEIFINHKLDRVWEKRERYSEIHADVKQEAKQLKKEIKAENREGKSKKNSIFKSSSVQFQDKNESFYNPIEEKFRKDGENAVGKPLFVEKVKKTKITGEQKKTSIEEVFSEKKEKAAKDKVPGKIQSKETERTSEKSSDNKTVHTAFDGHEEVEHIGNKQSRSVESYFDNSSPSNGKKDTASDGQRFMTKEERLEQSKSRTKSAKKSENKEIRKAAAMTAVAKMFNAKRNMQNQLGDMSGQGTGDLLKDGSSGLLQTFISGMKELAAHLARKVRSALWKCVASALAPMILPISGFLLLFILLAAAVSGVGSALSAGDAGVDYDIDVDGDGYLYQSLEGSQIDEIIDALYVNYADMSLTQETVIRYALSKVGCPYNQAYHGNLSVDIFDCSSLAYRSYLEAGIAIDNAGAWSAAAECYQMDISDKVITGEMKPGDLIFYGGSDNGRYLGVYHVAIYVGNINGADKMVEARGTSWGVVYGDARSNNVVRVARPY